MTNTLRGRFAPSPSGRMHLGNVFCALLSWLAIRSQGGEVVLRIEDLDTARCREEYTQQLLDDLRYLGLTFDEGPAEGGLYGPYYQSKRTQLYQEALEHLMKTGAVYPCYCSRDELHAASAPHASDGRILYSGTCRNLTEEERLSKHRAPAYRIKACEKEYSFTDGVFGKQTVHVRKEWGDFILRRSDGLFAYQLAVVVDDALMKVNQVVRGRDLLSSVAPQLQLYEALGFPAPSFYHVPLLCASDGRRLSKRDKDLDLGALRQRFPKAEPLIGYLLFLAGILPKPESLSAKEAVSVFSWDTVSKKDIIVSDMSRYTD